MLQFLRIFLVFISFSSSLFAELINTFYGAIEVGEPVLLELIHSPAMQRLKHIHQYGISYYTKTHPEEYTRFDHSLGVFAILRLKNATLEEQIAGLLHDVSHTAFSHLGDWVYPQKNQEDDYQSSIHDVYLSRSGIEAILNRHGYQVAEVSPKKEEFLMLEQPLPSLCADRIDYNIQGAYFQNFITKQEAIELLLDLSFENGNWVLSNEHLAFKLASFSLFMTEDCWGSAKNSITSRWLAEGILKGLEIGLISSDDFQFGIDEVIWDRLSSSQEPSIQKQMHMVCHPDPYLRLVTPKEANTFITFKCRGIDPWMKADGQFARLTSLNPSLKEAFQRTKQRSMDGWPVEILLCP